MTTTFQYRGYNLDCTPRPLEEGAFGAQVMLTRFGYHSEKTFDALPHFRYREGSYRACQAVRRGMAAAKALKPHQFEK
jgi:hypothetical protein